MACGISSGIISTCPALKRVGGVNKRAYLFNMSDLDNYVFGPLNYITDINFIAYKGTFKLESRKQSHSGGWTAVVQDPGGNKFFQHDVIIKAFPLTPADDIVIEDLLVADVGVILETNNREFILYGTNNGMDMTAGLQNTGQAAASDVSDTLTFQGEEEDVPKRILINDYATTKAYLETLLV